jgi:hypothetical protein
METNQVTVAYSIELPNGTKKEFRSTLNLPPNFKIEQLGQDPLKFVRNAFMMTLLSISKGVTYGDSWRGGKGASQFKAENMCALGNVMRKYDRVMNCAERGIVPGRIDGAGDLAVYLNLYLQLLEEFYPKEFIEWFQKEVVDYVNQNAKPESPLKLE